MLAPLSYQPELEKRVGIRGGMSGYVKIIRLFKITWVYLAEIRLVSEPHTSYTKAQILEKLLPKFENGQTNTKGQEMLKPCL